MIKIGAGWNNFSENGTPYISYELDEATDGMIIDLGKFTFKSFENKEKKEEKQPDWNIFLAKKKDKQ